VVGEFAVPGLAELSFGIRTFLAQGSGKREPGVVVS
jgi:hypothetical protein